MNRKVLKGITIIATILYIIILATPCFAISTNDITGKNSTVATEKIGAAGNQIAAIIRTVGIIASVIILMILGIKYMMGSASEKAEYKKTMIPYVVGAVVLFGASALASAIYDMANTIAQ